jgi:radical SAM-linked protein
MDSVALARYRATFHKTEAMRFTSNLDLHRTLERTLRRAGLPLAYTLGFHPHPRLTLASALALGCTSEAELADFWLEEALPSDEVLARCQRASPSGIQVTGLSPVPLEGPALPTLVAAAEYEARLDPAGSPPDIAARVEDVMRQATIPRVRREKAYDLRPLIETLEVECQPHGGAVLRMRLAAREAATGRPEEVLLALDVEPAGARIHRTRLYLAERA